MSPEDSALLGLALGGAMVLFATPLAIRVAERTDFYDCPREYRKHAAPTPLLGGAAVLLAFLFPAIALDMLSTRFWVVIAGALAMWIVGTVDDRVAISPKWRLLLTALLAVWLDASNLGWATAAGEIPNLLLTILWIVGLVNAFNLMDNMDGACATVTCICAAGIGVLAAIHGDSYRVGMAAALVAASSGFLVWNLAGPAKIFLGDGGSMPLGFLIGTLAMVTARHSQSGNAGVVVGAMLAGVPIFDVTLVSVSRTRRRVSLLTGGRDHLTHRSLLVLRTPRRVAVFLALAQALLCGVALAGSELGTEGVAILGLALFVFGVIAVLVLDTDHWRPPGIATRERPLPADEHADLAVRLG